MAVSRIVESSGDEGGAVEDFGAWKQHLLTLLLELAAAVDDGEREQFAARVRWAREAFAARGQETQLLRSGLKELGAVLEEHLPDEAWAPLPEFFQAATRELERESVVGEPPDAMDDAVGEITAAYLSDVLAGESKRAIDGVVRAIRENRLSIPDALDGVLTRALRETGRKWHTGEVNVADEHFTTHASGRLLEQILLAAPAPRPNDLTVVLAMAEEDAHDFGLRILAAFFELDGWRTIFLGANTPSVDLSLAAQKFHADLVVIGATLNTHRAGVARAVQTLRSFREDQRILVGGPGFDGFEGPTPQVGADACVTGAKDALRLGRELVERG